MTLYPIKDFINNQIRLFSLSNLKWNTKLNKSFFVQKFPFKLRLIIAGIAISVNLAPNLINCLLTHPKPFGNFHPLQYSHAIKLPKEEEEEEEKNRARAIQLIKSARPINVKNYENWQAALLMNKAMRQQREGSLVNCIELKQNRIDRYSAKASKLSTMKSWAELRTSIRFSCRVL